MTQYIFENILNTNIEIRIKANNYTEAMELLLTSTRDAADYRLKAPVDEPEEFKYTPVFRPANRDFDTTSPFMTFDNPHTP